MPTSTQQHCAQQAAAYSAKAAIMKALAAETNNPIFAAKSKACADCANALKNVK